MLFIKKKNKQHIAKYSGVIFAVIMIALFLAVFSVKAQNNDNQDDFEEVLSQFYKDQIPPPLPPNITETENIGDSFQLALLLPFPPPMPPAPSFISKAFSPILKSAGKIKDGYLSVGEEILSLIDLPSDNLSAVVAIQDQHPFLLSFDVPPIQNVGAKTGAPARSAESAGAIGQSEEIMDFLKSQLALLEKEVKKIEKSGLVFSASAPAANADKIKGVTKEYLEERLNSINTSILNQINNLSSQFSVQTSAIYRTVSLTNKIDSLSGVSLSNIAVSGVSGLTDADIPDTITASSYLPLSGGTLTGALTGTALSLSGELTVSGTGTSTISGRLLATKAPTLAHTFSVWDTDTTNSNVLDSSILINPSSATADSNLFGIAVNDNVKFLVDAEGDVFVRNLTATGTVNQANTSISTLTVENTATFGDAVGDSVTINAGTITSVNPISWNLPNSQISALNFESGLFNLDTSNSRIGIGTSSPGTILSVSGVGNFAGTGSTLYSTLTAPYFTATSTTASTFPYASTTALTVSGNSYLGTVSSGTWNGALLDVAYGGTGWASIQSGSIPYGNGSSALSTTTAGTAGNILALLNGVPTWTATTTLSEITGTLSVSKGGTGQTSFGQGWINSDGTTLSASTSPTVAYLTATSTTATSTFAGGLTVDTSVLFVDPATNRVGINNATPSYTLDVTGTARATTGFYVDSSTKLGSGLIGGGNALYLSGGSIWLAGGSGLKVDTGSITIGTGKIGIGTTSPYSKLSVWGAGTGTNRLFELTDSASTTLASFQENGTGYFLGNIGIGTTSPYAKLSVVGETVAEYFTATSTTATSTFAGGITAGNNAAFVVNQLATANALTIAGNGNVGVGTAAPGAFLDVKGSYLANGVLVGDYAYSNNYTGIGLAHSLGNDAINLYSSVSDTNLYISRPTGKDIYFKEGGLNGAGNQVNIKSGGKVSIGTSTPYSKLSVWGAGTGTNRLFELTNSASTTLASFQENGTGYFLGNIGIGTTSPYAKLSVVGETVAEKFTATSTTATSTFAGGMNVAGTAGLTVLQNGNVGVGTAAPSGALHVVNANYPLAAFERTITNNFGATRTVNQLLVTTNSGSMTDGVGPFFEFVIRDTDAVNNILGDFGAVRAGADNTGDLVFRSSNAGSNTEKLRITSSGNIGIGTTSPYAKLSVSGDTALDSMFINFASSTAPSLTLNYLKSATSTIPSNTNYAWSIATSTTASPIFSISTQGSGANVNATTTINGGFNLDSGAILYDYSSGITTINALEAGPMNFADDAGMVTWFDLAVTSSSPLNTPHSYTAQIDSNDVLTIYSEADGSGTVKNLRVGIGTTTPLNSLTIHNATTTADADFGFTATSTGLASFYNWTMGIDISDGGKFKIASSTALGTNDRFVINGGGNLGIGGCADPDHIFEIGGTGTGCNTGAGSYLNAVGDLAFTANSSREWKQNIATYGKADILSRIKNAPVRTFDWKPEYCPSGNCLDKLGFIAEEFYGVLERGDDKHVNGQDVTMALWLGMQNFINVFDIASAATGTPALLIDALGNWKIGNDGALTVKEVRTEKLCVGSVCVTEEQFRTVFGNSQSSAISSESSSSASSQSSSVSSSSSLPAEEEGSSSSSNSSSSSLDGSSSSVGEAGSSSVSSVQSSSESSASISSASSETVSSSSSSISSAGVEELTSSSESSSSEAVSSSSSLSSESSSSSEASSSESSSSTSSSSDSSASSSSSVAESSSSSSSESASSEASI